MEYNQKGTSKRVRKKVHLRNSETQAWIQCLLKRNQFQEKKSQSKNLSQYKSQRNLSQYRKTKTVPIPPNNKSSTKSIGQTTSNKSTITPYKKCARSMKPSAPKTNNTPKEQQAQTKVAATTTASITTASVTNINNNKRENKNKYSNILDRESTVDNSKSTLQH